MNRKRIVVIVIFTLALILAIAGYFLFRGKTAPGILEASAQVRGTEVTVGSKLAGRVDKLFVEEGQSVDRGTPIAKISSEQVAARLEQVRARQEVVFHDAHQARATLQKADAEIEAAEAQRNLAKKDYERYTQLIREQVIARREFEEVEARFKAAQAKLDAVKEAKEEARAALERADAALLEVKGREKEMEATLDDTNIDAPAGGTVVNKLVEQGELVAAGTPIATLIDLSDLYVKVYIPEKDLGKIRLGNPVRIFSDAFPDRPFGGSVVEVSQKAEFTPKEAHVREERTKLVFGVKVKIDNPQGYLKPGMPVDVKIKWRDDVPW